ncbi:hypothetical protein [Streptomyces palmae]|uniref:Uncharacterized protein n=1 Tax=Streptomyces palmae TaxID=1701085 RepID=A0A4Z0HAW0_9ACTN|nr:hypothetical protein [Streptomyces palmae]TGB15613.1 hypothetical protein E4099_06550 [Streptomyces palmae]
MSESEIPAKSGFKVVGIGCAAVLLAPVLLLVGVIVTYAIERAIPEDYPDAKPEVTARRITAYSQEAFAVIGLDRTLESNVYDMRAGNQNTLGSDYCYPDGLESIADEPEKGAYRMYHAWMVGKVGKRQGLEALRRVHARLKDTGWRITQFEEDRGIREWIVRAERDGGYHLSVVWEADYQRLRGGTGASCATDPDWTEEDGRYYEPHVGAPPTLISAAAGPWVVGR